MSDRDAQARVSSPGAADRDTAAVEDDPEEQAEAAGPTPENGAGPGDVDFAEEYDHVPAGGVDTPELDLLADALRERDEYLDSLRRVQADFENYRKRMSRQQEEASARAVGTLVERILPALDTADLAVAHSESEELRQVRTALLDALQGAGLERIAPDGETFDPTRHDAVAHEPAEDGAESASTGPEVAELLRAGYAWNGRLLRPAMVRVRG